MRIVLITQEEPFFLAELTQYLLRRLPANVSTVGAVLLSPSPFGKKEGGLAKLRKTYRIFGLSFLIHYLAKYARKKLTRSPSIADVLRQHGAAIVRLEKGINTENSLDQIRALKPDLLVSIGGNEVFRRPLIELAPKGCINLHSALLPKYRGLMPSFWVLRFREKFTGVSVFLVDEGIDTGPILVQKRIEIGDMTQEQLIEHSKLIGMDAIVEAIEMLDRNDPSRLPNDPSEATYFTFPTAADVQEFRKAGAKFY